MSQGDVVGDSLAYTTLTTWVDTERNRRYCTMMCNDLVREGVRARVAHAVHKDVPRVSVEVAQVDLGLARRALGVPHLGDKV